MKFINEASIIAYIAWLTAEERAAATIQKYARDVRMFATWLQGVEVSKEKTVEYKNQLIETHMASSVNTTIASLNSFFFFMGWSIKLNSLKIQKQTFRDEAKELTREEYERLVKAALNMSKIRIGLIIQTIASTGIRVSELRYITVSTTNTGKAVISNKGKTRTVFLPLKLQVALLDYAKENDIESGCIFVTRTGKPIDRRDVWAGMKALCKFANVSETKVTPHNLRHLFALEFYGKHKDVIRLADVLGHSNMNTTRIYTMETGAEHRRLVNELGFVVGF